jgi:translation initiation factor 2B subunit (eIF-2B alpha/beta/delta family)
MLKCDIEGAERLIFADCRSWIQHIGVIVVETHPPYSLQLLQEDLKRCGASHTLVMTALLGAGNEVGTFLPQAVTA